MFAVNEQKTLQAALARAAYSRDDLLLVRGGAWCVLQPEVIRTVRAFNLRSRRRGTRAGQHKQRSIHKVVLRSSSDPKLAYRNLDNDLQRTSVPGRTDCYRLSNCRRSHRALRRIDCSSFHDHCTTDTANVISAGSTPTARNQ